MTSWWEFLNHWQRKSIPSKSNWLTYFKRDRDTQFDCRQNNTKYTHMTFYLLNYNPPRKRKFFSLTNFLPWFPLKHRLSFEFNSETRGKVHQIMYLKLRDRRARREYQRRRGLHLWVLTQPIVSTIVCMNHQLWVTKSEVPFVLIIVRPWD